jgi:hypothetical protein
VKLLFAPQAWQRALRRFSPALVQNLRFIYFKNFFFSLFIYLLYHTQEAKRNFAHILSGRLLEKRRLYFPAENRVALAESLLLVYSYRRCFIHHQLFNLSTDPLH